MAQPPRDDSSARAEASAVAERLRIERYRILERFLERVQAVIPAAAKTSRPILINTFPDLLSAICDVLEPEHPRKLVTEGTNLAEEHGGERVRLTGYRTDDLIREFQVLRDVIFEVLEEAGPIPDGPRRRIISSLDAATVESCTAFHLVDQRIRQQFVVALTHDLRGPLTAAKAGAELILRKPGSPEAPRWAARVIDSIERVDKMVRDVLDASRVGDGGRLHLLFEPLEICEIVHEVLEQLKTIHGDRFDFTAHPPVNGHWSRDALRRAVENLVTNAVKYGASGQPISVSVGSIDSRVTVRVHNKGSYIPPEERETLFQAFRRARAVEKSATQGWGIGLTLVRAVAEAHGGSIGVDSVLEVGTTFIIDIPLDARPFQHALTLE